MTLCLGAGRKTLAEDKRTARRWIIQRLFFFAETNRLSLKNEFVELLAILNPSDDGER